MLYFWQGLTIGLVSVAPIGLQNLFVINTALTQPRLKVYMTALIVILFDISLAVACFFGMGALIERSKTAEMAILLSGSLLVTWIGIGLLRAEGNMTLTEGVEVPLPKVIATACLVTWFNPQALIDGAVMLGAFKASLPPGQDMSFILGVAAASSLWFLVMSTIIILFSAKITNATLRKINVICGIVVVFYGAKLGYHFLKLLGE
ncbi:MAG: LysE/ArgO family amino acid transporter [Acidaminococcaceae bacterium]